MWKCYYCSGTNRHDWWRCNWCNAPKREPEFVGTPGYDSGYDMKDGPYFSRGGVSTRGIEVTGISGGVVSQWAEYPETIPAISRHTGVCEMVPVTNYKPSRGKWQDVLGWIQKRYRYNQSRKD